MTTPITLAAMAVVGLGAGEAVVRLRHRMEQIFDAECYPGATLQLLFADGFRPVAGGLAARVSMLAIWIACSIAPLPPMNAVALAFFLTLLAAGALVDAHARVLPDEITGSLVWGGLIAHWAGIVPWGGSIETAVIGVVVGYGAVWLVAAGYCGCRGMAAIGHGDLKMIAGLSAWLGVGELPAVILGSCVLQVVAQLVMRRRGVMAFGPALAATGAILATLKLAGVELPLLRLP